MCVYVCVFVCVCVQGKREVGDTAVFGYLTQYPPEVRQDMRIIDYLR